MKIKWSKFRLLIASVITCAACSLHAATYYVSPTGNDTTGDGTSGKPWATIGFGDAQGLTAGDTVMVQAGTYTPGAAGVVLAVSAGTADEPITYKADGKVVIDQTGLTTPSFGFDLKIGGISLDGFEIKGAQH